MEISPYCLKNFFDQNCFMLSIESLSNIKYYSNFEKTETHKY